MEDIKPDRKGVRALKWAALLQTVMGMGVGAYGVASASGTLVYHHPPSGFQGAIFASYFPLGLAAALLALPLARGIRWAWQTSRAVTSALLLLPVIELMYAASFTDSGPRFGPGGSLLLLFWVVPCRLFLSLFYRDGRTALRD